MKESIRKQEAEQAILPPPAYIQDIVKESRESEIEPGENLDKLMIEFSQSEAWKVLKKFINTKRTRLEEMTRQSIRKDQFDLQSTGFRYLIFDQVDSFAQDLINRVEGPAKIREVQQNTQHEDL